MNGPAGGSDDRPRVFLFTDIEDSTVLWEQHPQAMADATAELDGLVSLAAERQGGRVVKRLGDAMDLVFETVEEAVRAAVEAQRSVADTSWDEVGSLRLRMAIDVGEVTERDGTLFGPVLNRLGRILVAGHGGQILASADAAALMNGSDVETRDLGEFRLKGIGGAQRIYQVAAAGDARRFPPLRVDHPEGRQARNARTVWGYEIGEEVGVGRLGALHRGYQPSTGRDVAVRVVRPELVNDPWFVRRFEAEARIVARLDHVHLVEVRDAWRDPDGAYLVMPWIGGGSLEDALSDGPWDLGAAARLIAQVGAALVYLHERGLVHGGVRPSNVLFDDDGEARLTDAWLALRLLGGEADEGTPIADDVRGLAALVVAVLVGDPAVSPHRLPEVSELRPEVDPGVDLEVARAIAGSTGADEGAVRRFLDEVLPALESGVEIAEPVRNPYKGLAPFGESDAADFFGREELLRTLIDAVTEVPLVAVVGPSGSGKSSLVRAGLVPAAHRGRLGSERLVTDLHPGSRPFAELEAALRRIAHERTPDLGTTLRNGPTGLRDAVDAVLPDDALLLLVIDQFEELFTLVDDEGERRAFLDALVALDDPGVSRVTVVVTLRADFFDRPLEYPAFGALMRRGVLPVTPLDEDEVEAAIVGPARNVGLAVEPELVAEIRRAVGDEPGRLPLLQFAMTELFESAQGGTLTLDTFRAAGGLTGALARRAEQVYGDLADEVQEVARQVFLRLVTLGEGTEDTRRRVPRGRLLSLDDTGSVELVLEHFGDGRLLSFDRDVTTREPTVEVAHEALLRYWPRVRGWIDEARDDLRSHRRLRRAAEEWQESGQDATFLLAPARVEPTEAWLASSSVALSDDEAAFLDASRARRQQLEAAEAERAAHEVELERRAVTRLRMTVGVLGAGVIAAALLTIYAFDQQGIADQERLVAEQQRAAADEQREVAEVQRVAAERASRVATARGLASAAVSQLDADPELSVLLGLAAIDATREVDGDVLPEAETALRRAVRRSHVVDRLERDGGFASVAVGAGGEVATLSADGMLTVWDPSRWEPLLEVGGLSSADDVLYDDIDISPDGTNVVVVSGDRQGLIVDLASGRTEAVLEGAMSRPRFTPDGRSIVALAHREAVPARISEVDPTVGVWDATTGEVIRRFDLDGQVYDLDVDPTSSWLATAPGGDHPAHLLHLRTGEVVWTVSPGLVGSAMDEDGVMAVAFHPAGDRIAFGRGSGSVEVRAAEDGRLIETFAPHAVPVQAVAFSPDGEQLVSGGQDGRTQVTDLGTGRVVAELLGHGGPVSDAAFRSDGDQVITTSSDGTVRIWEVPAGSTGDSDLVGIVTPHPGTSSFSPDGDQVATPTMSGVRVLDPVTLEELRFIPTDDPVLAIAHSNDGRRVAAATTAGYPGAVDTDSPHEIHIWDQSSEEPAVTLSTASDCMVLAFSPDDESLAAGCRRRTEVFDLRTGELRFVHPAGRVSRVLFMPDADRLVAVGDEGAYVLDSGTGDAVHELAPAAFDADVWDRSRILLTLPGDSRIDEWDVETGERLRTVRRESASNQLSVRVAGETLIVGHGGADRGRITVHDRSTEERRMLDAPNLWSFEISPDGRYLVTNHYAPEIHIHLLRHDDLLEAARARLTRWWTEEECEEFLEGPCPERVAS